jgi:hypothetical protein
MMDEATKRREREIARALGEGPLMMYDDGLPLCFLRASPPRPGAVAPPVPAPTPPVPAPTPRAPDVVDVALELRKLKRAS